MYIYRLQNVVGQLAWNYHLNQSSSFSIFKRSLVYGVSGWFSWFSLAPGRIISAIVGLTLITEVLTLCSGLKDIRAGALKLKHFRLIVFFIKYLKYLFVVAGGTVLKKRKKKIFKRILFQKNNVKPFCKCSVYYFLYVFCASLGKNMN